jgi:hypothetical protein
MKNAELVMSGVRILCLPRCASFYNFQSSFFICAMHIGVDFDNTIVCYDPLFHKVAREKNLIPAEVPVNKSDVRNYLRRIGNEDAWTEMQGYVYGARMAEAAPYPGVMDFFEACRAAGIRISIISHKSLHPFLGEQYDLHRAAIAWLGQQGFFGEAKIGLPRDRVFFELTKAAKLERIGRCGCTHFIDDLPEFLAEAAFPANVQRILFDSNNLYAGENRFLRIRAWNEARNFLCLPSKGKVNETHTETESETPHVVSYSEKLREKLLPFVRQHGIVGDFVLEPLSGGANNRVYRLRAGKNDRVLKVYFHNPGDGRDRFRAEQAFYAFIWSQGVRRTPEPFGWNANNRFGLVSFIEGRKLRPEEVNEGTVQQALEFIIEANRTKTATQTNSIPVATEACFSIGEHLACVDRRIARLQNINLQSGTDARAAAFVRNELLPAWDKVRAAMTVAARQSLHEILPQSDHCLSPSDFGFHNALLPANGQLCFFDFEYAGWDDPAKLVCDFFCQPQLSVGPQHWDGFVTRLAGALRVGASLASRARLLLPAYQIKWCCIMLNDFVRSDQTRREFALGDRATEATGEGPGGFAPHSISVELPFVTESY